MKKQNIALIGFMGCGKSTVGQVLSNYLGYQFIDLDQAIVAGENKTIPQIFEEKGQVFFRNLEFQYANSYTKCKNIILSTGGGCVTHPATLQLLKENFLSVFLKADFEILYQRIAFDSNRPLVTSNSKEQLQQLYTSRLDLYQQAAKIIVDATLAPLQIAKEIKRFLP